MPFAKEASLIEAEAGIVAPLREFDEAGQRDDELLLNHSYAEFRAAKQRLEAAKDALAERLAAMNDTLCWQLVELYWASALLLRAGKRELEDNAGKAAVVGKLLSRVFGRTLSRVVEAVWGEKAIAARISGLRAEAERYDRRMDLIIEDLAKRQQENDLNGTATLAMLEQAEREFCATMAMVQTHPDKYRPRKGDDPWGVTRQAFSKFSRQNAWHSIYYIRRRAPNAPLPLLMKQKERAREMKEWTERRGAPWGTSEDTQEVLELYEQQLKEADERIKERLEAIGVAEPAIDTQRTAASNKTSNRTTDELL